MFQLANMHSQNSESWSAVQLRLNQPSIFVLWRNFSRIWGRLYATIYPPLATSRSCHWPPKRANPLYYDYSNHSGSLLPIQNHQSINWNRVFPKRSSLSSLSPFLNHRILRVGDRFRNAKLSCEQKHHIILPAKVWVVLLHIRWVHKQYFHANKLFIINFLNSQFWIVGNLKAVMKKMIFDCVVCRRYRGEIFSADNELVTRIQSQPRTSVFKCWSRFCRVFQCSCINHRTTKTTKVCAVIFVCSVSRAIHIEGVSNLTTASFLDVLKRFMSRQWLPQLMLSDNGRTFVWVKNRLKRWYRLSLLTNVLST